MRAPLFLEKSGHNVRGSGHTYSKTALNVCVILEAPSVRDGAFFLLVAMDTRIRIYRECYSLSRTRDGSEGAILVVKGGSRALARRGNVINYATPALEKGLDVLELLAHQSEGLTKSQLACSLNRTVSEIFRMLLCLERRGYIAQVTEERYSLTLKLFKLVQEHPPTERLIVDALPVMNQLAHETLQSCHLGVFEGGQVVILAQVNASTDLGFYVKPGSTVDPMESASGYVILAHQQAEQP